MKIVIDLTSLADNFSGIERYAANMAFYLIKIFPENKYVLLFKEKIFEQFTAIDGNKIEKIILPRKNKLWFMQVTLTRELYRHKADWYLFLAFPAPFFFYNQCAISAIHDMGCWDCPRTMKFLNKEYFKLLYWKVAQGGKKIITVSQFSQKRIVEHFQKNLNDVWIIHSSLSITFIDFQFNSNKEKEVRERYNLPEQYILCLSTLEPRKNLRLLIDAFTDLIVQNKLSTKLVLAGRNGWKMNNIVDNLPQEVKNKILFTGFIQEQDLPYIYQIANVFVFPSMYEGFGLPPVEAMSMGVPVISSNSSSLPEVLGNLPVYFENGSKDALKKALIDFNNLSGKEITAKSNGGRVWCGRYNWKHSVELLMKELNNIENCRNNQF